jgi:hypothetical protein
MIQSMEKKVKQTYGSRGRSNDSETSYRGGNRVSIWLDQLFLQEEIL